MRVISKKVLTEFWSKPEHRESEMPLRAWHHLAASSTWNCFADIKRDHRPSDAAGNGRVIFNVGGNKFRLVVAVSYRTGFVLIKFVGTHEQYDKIDPATVELE